MQPTTQWTQEKWNEATSALMRRASTDAGFRKKCLTDPQSAIKEVSGLELPAGVKVRFVNQVDELVVKLPPLESGTGELSDDALERVAGGFCLSSSALCTSSNCSTFCLDRTNFCF